VIPSFGTAMKLFGLATKSAVHYLFKKREREGLLIKHGQRYVPTDLLIGVPLAQTIAAGFDAPARDANRYTTLNLHTYLIEKPHTTFLLEVTWDSMVEAGILSGDTVIIDRAMPIRSGDIVVAHIDDEYTLKYFHKDAQGRVSLVAANHKTFTDPLYPDQELAIVGVVVGTFRKYI
jgi:SOS-response transcriptional repressor LexA